MHETVIAKSILDNIEQRLSQHDLSCAATSVRVRVGEFRNVDRDSLTFAFNVLRNDYPRCQQCALILDTIKLVAICQTNGHTYQADLQNSYRCTECGSGIGELIAGRELDIVDIVVTADDTKRNNAYAWTNK